MSDRPKILICDDEEGVRESLKLILEDNYDLLFAANGPECLKQVKSSGKIDLVMLDIKMPHVDGLEVLKQIKAARPDIKIIMVTGYRSSETAMDAVKYGVAEYIIKPFESREILDAVKKTLK